MNFTLAILYNYYQIYDLFFAFTRVILHAIAIGESPRVRVNDGLYAEIAPDDSDETAFYHNPHFHDLSRSRITSRLEKSSRGKKQ